MSGIAALVLAAGQGSRFRGDVGSKLLAPLAGEPLVARVAATALASRASPVVVVTGHMATEVESTLAGFAVTILRNPTYRAGLAGSLRAGVAALPEHARGALVLLADMPLIRAATLDRLIQFFEMAPPGTEAVVPVFEGRSGNPALIARSMFADLRGLSGDQGARKLLAEAGRKVVRCAVEDPGVAIDIDTCEALRAVENGNPAQAAERSFP